MKLLIIALLLLVLIFFIIKRIKITSFFLSFFIFLIIISILFNPIIDNRIIYNEKNSTPNPDKTIISPNIIIPNIVIPDIIETIDIKKDIVYDPNIHPDILDIKNSEYESMPVFYNQNEISKYIIYNFLNNEFSLDFYISKDLILDEGSGYALLSNALESAMTYYLFSSYSIYDMYVEDKGYEDKVYGKIYIIFTNPELDLEARTEAINYLTNNPPPKNGFISFEEEKAYAKEIHDFIAKKVTYNPIGYEPESMIGKNNFEIYQEAYNVLGKEENSAVCAAYARAFALIAQYAGINTAWVRGNETDTESHAWNIIFPKDKSETVLVDVTWDDTLSDDNENQKYVITDYFYLPLNSEYEHFVIDYMEEFIHYINSKDYE